MLNFCQWCKTRFNAFSQKFSATTSNFWHIFGRAPSDLQLCIVQLKTLAPSARYSTFKYTVTLKPGLGGHSRSHGMLQSLPRWQTPTFRPLRPQLALQLRWRRPENKPTIRRIVRVVRVPADCFGNFGSNQRICCAVLNDQRSRIASVSADDKEAQFLFQRLAIALPRFNQAWTGHCAIVPWHRRPPSTNTGAPWPLQA